MAEIEKGDLHAALVDVFETNQESEAMVIQGLLDSAGIESILISREAPQDVLPGVGGVIVRVDPEVADQAKKVIAEYHNDDSTVILDDSEIGSGDPT